VLLCYKKAKNILEQHREVVDRTAKLLVEKETIDSNQIDALLNGTSGEIANDENNIS
jgi:cell division protease FtsH